jgi:predicted deacylase
MDIPVYVLNAKTPGPVVLVQGGLYAYEVNGVEIVRRMLHNGSFNVNTGAVIAVPILNMFEFIHYSRAVPDGKDVNRSFPETKSSSIASRIAYHYPNEILPQIDFAIDLGTGGSQRQIFPQIRYTREDEKSTTLAKMFNAPLTFFSKLIKGSFRNAAFRLNKPAIVFEVGASMRFDNFSTQQGISIFRNVLR